MSDKKDTIDNSFGPNKFQRDEFGLLKNVQYIFNDDGSVNWRAMVARERIYPNRDWFLRNGKDIPESIEGLPDYKLVITLAGLKELANLRGFHSVNYLNIESSMEHVSCTCRICWLPNYETNMEMVYFEDMASAHVNSVDDFGVKYLDTIAANRAFARCVRNFLNIHVVSSDEIFKSNQKVASKASDSESGDLSPQAVLKRKFVAVKGTDDWEDFLSFLRELWVDGKFKDSEASKWQQFSDIPAKHARKILSLLRSN